MQPAFTVASIILSVILTGLVLLQAKGVGLGKSFGSTAYHSRRGMERIVFRATIVTAVLFTLVSVLGQLFVK